MQIAEQLGCVTVEAGVSEVMVLSFYPTVESRVNDYRLLAESLSLK